MVKQLAPGGPASRTCQWLGASKQYFTKRVKKICTGGEGSNKLPCGAIFTR